MPECLAEMLEGLKKVAPVLALSVLGGVVNYVNKPRDQFYWGVLVGELITALFVGLVVHLILQPTSLPPGIKSAMIALSGYVSRDVLFLLKRFVLKRIKRELS